MADRKITGIVACVFDAYGTLFDVHSAVEACRTEIGPDATALSDLWRAKQVQYSWLRNLMNEYAPFWQVTGDALDFALDQVNLTDPNLREKLMSLYLNLACYQEVPTVLQSLKASGLKTAILSNGSREMLSSAVTHSKIEHYLDAVMSVDEVEVFKVDPKVYRLATARFSCKPEEICFMSSNGWDAWAAAHFGFKVVWVNRSKQSREQLPGKPTAEIRTLRELPSLLDITL